MEIKPLRSFNFVTDTAPDKSITHRAIMLNAVAEGKAKITNALLGEDCLCTIECMKALGATITVDGNTVYVEGTEKVNSASLNVGNSGTTFRLLGGLLSSRDGNFTLDGDSSIRRRPMKRIIDPLTQMGASITYAEGKKAPISIVGNAKMRGISYEMPVASAQVKSAILLAGLNSDRITTVHEKIRSRNHTELMLKAMGAKIWIEDYSVSVMRSKLKCVDVAVPGDISSATYPLVLASIIKGSKVTVKNVGINPTRTGLLTVLQQCGAFVTLSAKRALVEKSADITVEYSTLQPFSVGKELIPYLIDEIPALAVLACFIDGESVISGAEELKVKETNRIDTTVAMLKAMGADIEATDDGMIIRGGKGLKGGCTIDPKGDHRIAMCASIAGCASSNGVEVLNPECAYVSYPDFYEMLGRIPQ